MARHLINTVGQNPDPDDHPTIPFPPEMDLEVQGFEVVELGIRELVKVLWKFGYRTVCSCAGHRHDLEPYPWVVIPMNLAVVSNPLEKLAKAVARYNVSLEKDGKMPQALMIWTLSPLCRDQELVIYLQPLDTNTVRSLKKISELRRSATKMAHFMRDKCKDIFS
jgi:hypothetical protein